MLLHMDRGLSFALRRTEESLDQAWHMTEQALAQQVLNVLASDEDGPETHPWRRLATQARTIGITTSADELRQLKYDVAFTNRVLTWLSERGIAE